MRVKELIEKAVAPEEDVEIGCARPVRDGKPLPRCNRVADDGLGSPRGNARRDVRVKVNMTHGNQMDIANTAVVGVRATPRVIAGRLSPGDTQAVFQWVALNTDVLVGYWEGKLTSRG